MSYGKNFYLIRRGYGAFVPCKNELKARTKALAWYNMDQGGNDHPVIGLFICHVNSLRHAQRTELYNKNGPTGL